MKNLLLVAALVLLIAPASVFAGFTPPNVWSPGIVKGPLVTCSGPPVTYDAVSGKEIPNPNACQSLCDLLATIIIYFGIGLVIWILAPLFFVVSGVMFLIAGANPEEIGKAKKMLVGTAIGVAIVLSAWIIVNTFIFVLGVSGIGGFGTNACPIAPVDGGTGVALSDAFAP
jgi:hypothetical protein